MHTFDLDLENSVAPVIWTFGQGRKEASVEGSARPEAARYSTSRWSVEGGEGETRAHTAVSTAVSSATADWRRSSMPRVPFVGRLTSHEYVATLFGFLLVTLEGILHVIIFFLPKPVIRWFYNRSRFLFHRFVGAPAPRSDTRRFADHVRKAEDFEELCKLFGYVHEEHLVLTTDGYLLGIHRLPAKRGEPGPPPGTSTGKPVVYLHHGLLMNSEVWLCLTSEDRVLPFVLVEQGFDVWLGNNRGNKYSKKSIHHNPNSNKFWDFSIDDFAWHDIPDSIEYILQTTRARSLSYVGFSQGSAQAFGALSIHPQLNNKINVFIALAPAMSPAGLAAPLVDGLMKASSVPSFIPLYI